MTPRDFISNTITVIPDLKQKNKILIGLEKRDFATIQEHTGYSSLYKIPGWRLANASKSLIDARNEVKLRMNRTFEIKTKNIWDLGGKYYPSIGVIPERVYPMALEVNRNSK